MLATCSTPPSQIISRNPILVFASPYCLTIVGVPLAFAAANQVFRNVATPILMKPLSLLMKSPPQSFIRAPSMCMAAMSSLAVLAIRRPAGGDTHSMLSCRILPNSRL